MTNDSCVVVFGGSGGVGKAILECLQQRDVRHIIATYHSTQPLEMDGVQWVKCEISSGDDLKKVRTIVLRMEKVLWGIIFCIGVPSSKKLTVETSYREWISLFEINALGFIRAYVALSDIARRSHSRVLVFSSDTCRVQGTANGPYSASKTALESMAMTLAKEESQYGVRVNILAPSLIESPLADRILRMRGIDDKQAYLGSLPWKRAISLNEVASSAVSLVLDSQWQYVSGVVFRFTADV